MKKYIACLIAVVVFLTTVKSQHLSLFKNNKALWGYKDKAGTVVVEPKYYSKPNAFFEGRAVFTKLGLKGLLDEKGAEMLAPTYASISDFKYGFAVVTKELIDTAAKPVNGKPVKYAVKGIIDRNGKEIVPVIYKDLQGDFSNGFFVRAGNKPGEKIFYNTAGNIFTMPDGLLLLLERVDGKKLIAMKGGKYGIVDQNFKEILAFDYSRITPTENGLLIVGQNNLYGLMDSKLKWIIKPTYSGIYHFQRGYAIISNEEKSLGAINSKGVVTTEPKFEKIYRVDKTSSAIAVYQGMRSDMSGLVDLATGKIITPANYYLSPYDYDWGLIRFRKDNKKGLLDSTGKELFYDAYDDFSPGFSEDNRAWVMKQGKYGFIDKSGTLVIPMQYDMVGGFVEGLAKIKTNGKYGYINAKGDVVIPVSFTDAQNFESGIAWVKDETNRMFYIDKTGKEVK